MLSKKKQDKKIDIVCMQKGMVSQSVLGDLNNIEFLHGRVTSKPSPQSPPYYTQEDRQDANVHADFGVDLSW